MSRTTKPDLNALFQAAHNEGILSRHSLQALTVNDLGAQIEAGLGVSVDDITTSEVILVTLMIDDSGSIRFGNNTDVVRQGHNEVLRALETSQHSNRILVHTSYLNGKVLFPYIPLSILDKKRQNGTGKISYQPNPEVVEMTHANYNPNLGTPLYDQTVVLLGRVLAKYQEFSQNGVNARSITLLITDGADECSQRSDAADVKALVDDLVGEHHIVAAMGIDDGGRTDFRRIFTDMGIRREWILTPGQNHAEIRRAFLLFSQSAVKASQPATNFNQLALGGFGIN